MNESDSRTIRNAVAGLCGLALLLVLGWLVLREPPLSSEPPPVRVLTASPRARNVDPLFTPDDDAPRETVTNQVAESATANTNAAVIYREAFALYNALSKEEKELIGEWRSNVDASVAAELCEKVQPICDLLHQAATVSNCDWGLEQPIRFETRLPHLNPARNMARTAAWSVAHCRTGDPSAAIDDLLAASQLGQNVSSSCLIGHLVDLSMQGIVIDSVAEHASLLASAGDTRLAELFKNASYNESLRDAFELEADMVTREADKLAAGPPEEGLRELIQISDNAKAVPQIQSMGLEQVIADLRQVAELQRQLVQAPEWSDAEYRAWLTSVDEAGKTDPFVEVFVTGLDKAAIRTQAMTVRTAMAGAGLAVTQDGPDALQSHPDPSTGQPFAYTKTADGFELQSSFQFQEKPVALSFR
jgi:hypothetical protein